jgi:isoquinoline 1-oxidoreductase beta subunit
MAPRRVTRRDFVKTGAGLVLAFYLPPRPHGAASAAGAASDFAPNAWLRIGADGLVTLTLDKSELGQGAPTGLAIILAEELEADWARAP